MERTQQLNSFYPGIDRISFKQIAYLGICGQMFPLKLGPNTIGTDQEKCDILLNSNTISKVHAVINIINDNNYTLTDCNSAKETKIMKGNLISLKPFIPYPIKNGETIQFGDNFGIFKIIDDDDDLPATQILSEEDNDLPATMVRLDS